MVRSGPVVTTTGRDSKTGELTGGYEGLLVTGVTSSPRTNCRAYTGTVRGGVWQVQDQHKRIPPEGTGFTVYEATPKDTVDPAGRDTPKVDRDSTSKDQVVYS